MELREYWRIVRRRLWLVVGLMAVVLATAIILPPARVVRFRAALRFTVSVEPEPAVGAYYAYDHYYTWLASEYLVDDLAEVVGGAAFGEEVERALRDRGTPPSRPLVGVFSASTKHRTLTVQVLWEDAEELGRIVAAAQQVLDGRSTAFFGQLGDGQVDIRTIDSPTITPVGPGLRERLDLPLRLLLALVAGLALAFLLHYLDDAVYDRADVENLDITVLAELPPHPHRRRFFWQHPLP